MASDAEPDTRHPACEPIARDGYHSFTLRSARIVTAPKICRDFVANVVRTIGVAAQVVETAAICTSECVTNAYLHSACEAFTVRVAVRPRGVRVTVIDGRGGPLPVPRVPEPEARNGRGLYLVTVLADGFGAYGGGGVWFDLNTAWKGEA